MYGFNQVQGQMFTLLQKLRCTEEYVHVQFDPTQRRASALFDPFGCLDLSD
jgi:hypothetical protein